jgi:hypothetical protein
MGMTAITGLLGMDHRDRTSKTAQESLDRTAGAAVREERTGCPEHDSKQWF